jgi:hypothetical protein
MMILPVVSASKLRGESGRGWKEKDKRIGESPVGSMSLIDSFPSSPVYASINHYWDGCGTALSQAQNVLTDVCFSNGINSMKVSCSKLARRCCRFQKPSILISSLNSFQLNRRRLQ